MVGKLNLTREQLASFLKDHDQVRQFEQLFTSVDVVINDSSALSLSAADSKAQVALDQIKDIKSAVDLLITAPRVEPVSSSGGNSIETIEVNLSNVARRSGKFTITGLTGLTLGEPVLIQQAVGPYTGKGDLPDECEEDMVIVTASVTASDAITAYWNSAQAVIGNFKFNYMVGA